MVDSVAGALFCAYVLKLSCFYVCKFIWILAHVELVKLVRQGPRAPEKGSGTSLRCLKPQRESARRFGLGLRSLLRMESAGIAPIMNQSTTPMFL